MLYYVDKALSYSGDVCPVHILDYGLLLYVDFIIKSNISGWQDNCGTKAKHGGLPPKKGLADGSGDYKRLVF